MGKFDKSRGPLSPNWKGDKVGYWGGHSRLRGIKKVNKCGICGTTDPTIRYDWASKSKRYWDVKDFRVLCRSCHRYVDKGVDPPGSTITYKGVSKSMTAWAIDLGISYKTLFNRIRVLNMPLERALSSGPAQENLIYLKYRNKSLLLSEWARKLGLRAATLSARYRRGLSVEDILSTEVYTPKKCPNRCSDHLFKNIGGYARHVKTCKL